METFGASAFRGDHLLKPGVWAVGFVADWCPWSDAFRPAFERFAADAPGPCAYGDISDESNPLWETLAIDVVPTIVLFRDGVPVARRDGVRGRGLSAADLDAMRRSLADLARRPPT